MKVYRQGDVLIKEIKDIPKEAKEKDNTVAFGEATGHHHTFDNGAKVMVDTSGKQYVEIAEASTIVHQEHKPISIQKGMYEVIIQREFDLIEDIRQVMD